MARPAEYGTKEQIFEIYSGVWGAAPDAEGVDYWVSAVDSEEFSLASAAASFFDQPLVQEKYEGLAGDDLLAALYANIFKVTEPDAEGLAYWTERMEALGVSESTDDAIGTLVMEMIDGMWANEDAAETQALYANLVAASGQFYDFQVENGVQAYSEMDEEAQAQFLAAAQELTDSITADSTAEEIEAAVAEAGAAVSAPSGLIEALEAYEAADAALTEAEAAYRDAAEDAVGDDYDADADIDLEADLIAAEGSVLAAQSTLNAARQEDTDAALQTAVAEAQDEVNTDPERYTDKGELLEPVNDGEGYTLDGETYEGTAYTARQLQSRVDSAQTSLDAHVAANGSALELATQLNAALGEFIADGGTVGDDENDLLANLRDAYLELRSADESDNQDELSAWVNAVIDVVVADGSDVEPDGEARYVVDFGDDSAFAEDVAGSDEIQALIETIADRANLEYSVAVREAAFSGENDSAFSEAVAIGESSTAPGSELREAQGDWTERENAIEAVATAQANLEALEAAGEAYEAAVEARDAAAEALGYEIQTVDSAVSFGTDDADLFLFDFATLQEDTVENVVINDLSSDDLLYLGSDYVLGEGDGDNNALEVFITEVNGNAVLNVENTAYGSAEDDFTSITLTGVAAADLSFDNGVVSMGTVEIA